MGKHPNIEIIPLATSSTHNRQNLGYNIPHVMGPPLTAVQPFAYVTDPRLLPRVQKYLQGRPNKTYIDIESMADDLQKTYKEYARKKKNSFRKIVRKAYSALISSYNVGSGNSSSDEGSGDSEDEEDSNVDDTMNNQLVSMYTKPRKPIENNELIDISSDDDGGEKSINGPSTSQKKKDITVTYVDKSKETATNVERAKKRKAGHLSAPLLQNALKRKKSVADLCEPCITFKDVGGLDKVLEDICKLLVHIRHPEVYDQIGISPPRGFLLHGPPGCGKTLLAHAISGELGIPLLKVAAPELVAGVSGESEQRVRSLFERAVDRAPCILFIDEIDAITPNRQTAQKEMERRIVAQLLSCLDDLQSHIGGEHVLVIGATNRPDSIDPALRRAGRFDREVCLGIPDANARSHILKVLTPKLKLEENFDFDTVAKYTPGFVGADLLSLCREASMFAINRSFDIIKEKRDLQTALALQQATQELLKKQSSENSKPKDTSDVDKSSTKDDSSSALDVNEHSNTSDSAVVIIDDDVKIVSDKPEASKEIINEQDTEKFQQAIKLLKPAQTVLEGLIGWLHDDIPLDQDQLSSICVTMDDFAAALKTVQPSAKREGFATVPDVTWDNVGSLRNIREELQLAILAPVKHAEQFEALGLTTPTGVLLCGPPGCGKTLLAKAIANEAGINFISVKGPELLNMYVGESEKAVRVCFERARNSAPCVIFFDELDSLCPRRSETGEGGVTMRVVNQMLTEMDGIEGRAGVYLLAASNRPDIIDPAVLRPGRLDKIIYVGLPSPDDRVDILRAITKNGTKPQLAPDVNLELIVKSECDGYTGADLAALVREAGVVALKDFIVKGNLQENLKVTSEHLKQAVAKIRPSVSEKDQKLYEKLKKIYSVPSATDVEEMEVF